MDVQLQELIDKIKKDGVANAEEAGAKIIADAEAKAAQIVKDAEEKAEGIIKNAKAETERMEKSSEEAIAQAGRNIILTCRDQVNKEINAILQDGVEKAYDQEMLKNIIPETVKAWASKTDADDITVLLAPDTLEALRENLTAALKGVDVKSDSSITSGFRIGSKSESAFYDFSSDELVNLFAGYLNPKTAEIMKKASAMDGAAKKDDETAKGN